MASTVRTDKVGPVSGSADFILPTADGTVGQFLKTDGSLALGFATVATTGLNSVQTFTSSGAWTRPTGITKVIVEVQGGGGSGNRSAAQDYDTGGSGGGYAKKFIDVSSVTASVITIGAGGTVVTTTAVGVDGGDSSWVDTASGGSSTVTGVKGVGGTTSQFTPTTGGLGTGGDVNIQGGAGNSMYLGGGGGSMLGQGGWNGWNTRASPTAGVGYGSGGGAGIAIDSGAGAPGIIIVWEYK